MNKQRHYRAIPIGGKDFVYGWYVEVNNHHYILESVRKQGGWICIEVKRKTVSQSTGLKDKNGKDLDWWEGDIFEHPSGLCIIKWYEGGLYMHGSGGFIQVGHAAHWAVLPVKVGTIHTHPELMDNEKSNYKTTKKT